ncbi:hypothetical protein RRG08_032752 [Elysia crispata]|uniref:Reverse transcriptase zinc-binding domain-containing protein n=1 Tax=Elysia crispata TaxID=231223 RepID=A0AAE0YNY8_9GAST|nr:hypothetical protein RRG08_032752 [Elysia crispata]
MAVKVSGAKRLLRKIFRPKRKSLTWNEIWHMAPLQISFLIRSVYDFLPSNSNLVRWGKKENPTCPLFQSGQTTEHFLSSC